MQAKNDIVVSRQKWGNTEYEFMVIFQRGIVFIRIVRYALAVLFCPRIL